MQLIILFLFLLVLTQDGIINKDLIISKILLIKLN